MKHFMPDFKEHLKKVSASYHRLNDAVYQKYSRQNGFIKACLFPLIAAYVVYVLPFSLTILLIDSTVERVSRSQPVNSKNLERQEITLRPPVFFEGLLYFFLAKKDRESIPGDLSEEYLHIIVPKFGHRWGNVWYATQVLRCILPLIWAGVERIFDTLQKLIPFSGK